MTSEQDMPGYGRGEDGMVIHLTRPDGRGYCGAGTVTVSDRATALDAIQNHAVAQCIACSVLAATATPADAGRS